MLWLTGVSILLTATLGWLAYANGKKAGDIARDASEREQNYRDSLAIERKARDRMAVSMAMIRAFTAHDRLKEGKASGHNQEQQKNHIRVFNSMHLEAISSAILYQHDGEAQKLNDWYIERHSELGDAANLEVFKSLRGSTIDTIQQWNLGLLAAKDFPTK